MRAGSAARRPVERGYGGPVDDFLVDRVLLAVEQVPLGRVTSYGDIAAVVGTGPRQVGAVLSRYGSDVAWWRVTAHDGTMAPGLIERAREEWAAEGIPPAANRAGCRIAVCRADRVALARDYARALEELLARTGTPLPPVSAPASRALAAAGVSTLEHLLGWRRAELLGLPGVGPRALDVLEQALAAQGWRLREGRP